MNRRTILDELETLPADKQQEVADFIAFLRSRMGSKQSNEKEQAAKEPSSFVGMWADRAEMADSAGWVRHIRARDWGTPHA